MRNAEHLDRGQLTQFLDDELSESQQLAVQAHLTSCALCREKRDELLTLSARLDACFASLRVAAPADEREKLVVGLQLASPVLEAKRPSTGRVMRRFGWGMAIAASLALGIFLAPHTERMADSKAPLSPRAQLASFDINGESFIALPYSNPDLPLNGPRIVEMQVPVASLAAAGIVFAPVANEFEDRTVLANVVLGIDGQPLGLHVLSAE